MSDDRQAKIADLLARTVKATQEAREAWKELASALEPGREESDALKAEAAAMAERTEAINKRLRELLKIGK